MTGALLRVNPLVLVALAVLGMVASLPVRDLVTAGAVLVCYLVVALVALPWHSGPVWRYLPVLLGAASVGWSTWLLGGQDLGTAVVAGLRLAVLALPGVALAPLVDPAALADQLGQRLRMPARWAVALAAGLQRIDRIGELWQVLARARRARGLGPGRGPVSRIRYAGSVTFGLLVATMRDATAMAVAMDARGFATADRRTWAEPAPWRRIDSVMLAVGLVVCAVPYLLWWWGPVR